MSAVIQGATIAIELYYSGAWHDLTCDTTSASWSWGAPEALGPLTECEGGTLRVSLNDPNRAYDPENPSSPLLGVLKVGLGFRVTVDGSPAWTGVLQTWGYDRGSDISDLNGLDPIGQMSLRHIPAGKTLMAVPDGATSAQQAQYLLDLVEWPVGLRYFPSGTAGVIRGNHYVEGPALDGLHRIKFAELGQFFPMRDGRIGWHDRVGPAPPASSATINCGGIGLTDMWKAFGLGRLRNHIVISMGYGTYGPVLPPVEYRSVTTTPEFLQFAGDVTHTQPLPWDLWANYILDRLNPPPILTVLDTMVPTGAEVKQLTTAEFDSRWTVKVTGEPDVVVRVLGMTVDVEPGMIEVNAVTEDVVPPKTFLHVSTGTPGLQPMYLEQTAGVVSVGIAAAGGLVGQEISGFDQTLYETFVYFDTSSIPDTATITKAEFAAQTTRQGVPEGVPGSFANFDMQVRSGYSWRPTMTTADWRTPAQLSALTLRASLNTSAPAVITGDIFAAWSDAGSGLAGAINKTGETQLVICSSRHVAGTAPIEGVPEVVNVYEMRLRVYYT